MTKYADNRPNKVKAQFIRIFYEDPDKWCSRCDYENWTTLSFLNCNIVRTYLEQHDPQSKYIPILEERMAKYMKYCHLNKRIFPWPSHLRTPAARETLFDTIFSQYE